jgi:hypothetical protein
MRLISSLMVCLALSACATDYVSQLYQPNYGVRGATAVLRMGSLVGALLYIL